MNIRITNESDRNCLLKIHEESFGVDKGPIIAKLVDDLLNDETAAPLLSLVAEDKGLPLGHILFTKAVIEGAEEVDAQILAPLAVIPEAQGMGVGTELIREGLQRLKAAGTELVFVLGHPGYYPRCGFVPSGVNGFNAPYPIPEEHADAWMVQELNGNALGRVKGRVRCACAMDEPQHWRE